jgi:hypothetical protein
VRDEVRETRGVRGGGGSRDQRGRRRGWMGERLPLLVPLRKIAGVGVGGE